MAAKPGPSRERVVPRADPRCRSRIPVEVHAAGRVEHGVIADMSPSGVRIVGLALSLPVGTPLELRYAEVQGMSPKPVRAEFVRETQDGFAIRIVRD